MLNKPVRYAILSFDAYNARAGSIPVEVAEIPYYVTGVNAVIIRLSPICYTHGKFRNRTFGSSLLNFLAIRTNFESSPLTKRYLIVLFGRVQIR